MGLTLYVKSGDKVHLWGERTLGEFTVTSVKLTPADSPQEMTTTIQVESGGKKYTASGRVGGTTNFANLSFESPIRMGAFLSESRDGSVQPRIWLDASEKVRFYRERALANMEQALYEQVAKRTLG